MKKITILGLSIFYTIIIAYMIVNHTREPKCKRSYDKLDNEIFAICKIFSIDNDDFEKIVKKNYANYDFLSFSIKIGNDRFDKFITLLKLKLFDLTNGKYLNLAIKLKRNRMIKELLQRGATPTMEYFIYIGDYDNTKKNISHPYYKVIRHKLYKLAVSRNNLRVIELLLDELFTKDFSNGYTFYLYQIAAKANNVKLLNLLYKKKFNVHVKYIKNQFSLLDCAYKFGYDNKVINWFKSHGVKSKKYTKPNRIMGKMQDLSLDLNEI